MRGGTGWGAEFAKLCNKPLFVFDQAKGRWFTWTGEAWAACEPPVITHPHITGTGTRFLEESGKRAIEELFDRSFGPAQVAGRAGINPARCAAARSAEAGAGVPSPARHFCYNRSFDELVRSARPRGRPGAHRVPPGLQLRPPRARADLLRDRARRRAFIYDIVLHLGTALAALAVLPPRRRRRAPRAAAARTAQAPPRAARGAAAAAAARSRRPCRRRSSGSTFKDFFEGLFASPAAVVAALAVTGAFLIASSLLPAAAPAARGRPVVAGRPRRRRAGRRHRARHLALGQHDRRRARGRPAPRGRRALLLPALAARDLGAALLELRHPPAGGAGVPPALAVAGFAAAAATGYLAILLVLRWTRAGKLWQFGLYCWAVAGARRRGAGEALSGTAERRHGPRQEEEEGPGPPPRGASRARAARRGWNRLREIAGVGFVALTDRGDHRARVLQRARPLVQRRHGQRRPRTTTSASSAPTSPTCSCSSSASAPGSSRCSPSARRCSASPASPSASRGALGRVVGLTVFSLSLVALGNLAFPGADPFYGGGGQPVPGGGRRRQDAGRPGAAVAGRRRHHARLRLSARRLLHAGDPPDPPPHRARRSGPARRRRRPAVARARDLRRGRKEKEQARGSRGARGAPPSGERGAAAAGRGRRWRSTRRTWPGR